MSNRQIADRLKNILEYKANYGMGMRDLVDSFDLGGVRAGVRAGISGGGNVWIDHIKKYQSKHPGMTYGEAMVKAASSYKKIGKPRVKRTPGGCPKGTREITVKGHKNKKGKEIREYIKCIKERKPKPKRECPEGTRGITVKGYEDKNGRIIKEFIRCIKNKSKKGGIEYDSDY